LVSANILAIIVAGMMFLMLIRMMKVIRQMIATLSEIAKGNLDNDIPTEGRDELGVVLGSLASMQVQLRVMMEELRLSVQNIFQRLRTLDQTAEETRSQSNSQSDRVLQVSAAMEQVSVSVAEVASHAGQVLEASQNSLSLVNQGSANMNSSLNVTEQVANSVRTSSETINELNIAIQKIGGITNVIKEIADQTNLLALNAAIEAARAGEQGRGFAVVADEVRKLAERTGSSTTDISKMLSQVVTINSEAVKVMMQVEGQVNDARQNLNLSEASFSDIRQSSQQVTEMARSIANATNEQAEANHEVAQNMEKMSQGAEKTSSLVNELHHATDQMKVTAEELKEMLAQFNVRIN
jgi:aerotaxis receptor